VQYSRAYAYEQADEAKLHQEQCDFLDAHIYTVSIFLNDVFNLKVEVCLLVMAKIAVRKEEEERK
jgi:hypothetical protein